MSKEDGFLIDGYEGKGGLDQVIGSYTIGLAGISHIEVADIKGTLDSREYDPELVDPRLVAKQYGEVQGCYPDKHSHQIPSSEKNGTIYINKTSPSENLAGEVPIEFAKYGDANGCF